MQYRIARLQPSLTQQAAPVTNAGISQTVQKNTTVVLDGRKSYTPKCVN
jgi:hypothetical protein